jgi:peptidoglycan biosynthesis protein MviN/MurJ (putative lipid II flippase)
MSSDAVVGVACVVAVVSLGAAFITWVLRRARGEKPPRFWQFTMLQFAVLMILVAILVTILHAWWAQEFGPAQ